MTTKNYRMLARVIGEAWGGELDARCDIAFSKLVAQLSRELQRDNPKFNLIRFRNAVDDARVDA